MFVTGLRSRLSALTSLVAAVVLTVPAAGQGGTIHVTVTDRTNSQPINGARVVLQNTRFTGLTDGRGELLLAAIPPGTYGVRVLSIGYRSATEVVTVAVGGTANVEFALSLSAVALDEIVVTGTGGAVEKRKLGTTLGTVNVARVQDIVDVAEFGSVLRARIPGVRSYQSSGGVGSGKELMVRGISSFQLGQRPVVYIDGVRVDTKTSEWGNSGTACCSFSGGAGNDRLNDLNPADIERIEVIKGAAAATLYGTEATNGVIQIFTKQGRSNSRPRWTVSYGAGFNRIRSNLPTKLNSNFSGPDGFQAHDANEMIQSGLIQRGDITVQGGGESVTYFLSTGISYEEGSIQPNDQLRGNVRLNLNWTASDKWNFELQSAFTKNRTFLLQEGNNWTTLLGNALLGNPLQATEERPYGEPWVPVANIRQMKAQSFADRWTGGVTLNFNPTEAFGHRFTLGLDEVSDRRERFYPWGVFFVYVGNDAERSVGHRNFDSWTLDYLGTLSFDMGSSIQSDFSFGAQGFWELERTSTAIGEGYAGKGVSTVSGGAVRNSAEDFEEEINVGLFAQDRFSISDKLFVTVGARLDGNSAFGENFGLQFYPKGEAAYVISEEGFLPSAISTMKLRAAVGKSGLAPGAFDQFRTFTPTSVLEGENGVRPDNPGNADLEPEQTTEYEGGLDLGLFDDRLSIEFTGYYAKTTGALLDVDLPPSRGFVSSQLRNIGALRNQGWEAKIDAAIIEGDNFRWSTGINMSGNSSKILDLGPFAECNAAKTECSLGNFHMNKAVDAYYRRIITGYDAATNTFTRSDTNVYLGDALPDWTGSLAHTVELGDFRFYGLMTWEKGAIFHNRTRARQGMFRGGDEYLALVNPDGSPTRSADSLALRMQLVSQEDERDHLRIQEVSVTYQLPNAVTSRLGLGRTTLALSGQNLMWWDHCNCYDPGMASQAGASLAAGNISGNVIGYAIYGQPQPRTFIFSLRTTF